METSMIPPAPPPPALVKTMARQSRDPPRPQPAAIPIASNSKPPVQETGHGPDQNSQPEEPSSSPPIEENALQSPPPDSQGDNPPDVETILPPVQETSPAAEALNSPQNETAVEEDQTQEREDIHEL
ncbi:hypothetical protein OJAV_G00008190 [Oryzias javanicus]|uniref:Uncharacterized protein n=1 Tax=Oryzias javanicus TaxID=123683 RepID=A0A437DN57_ORYJA|nr:hypothetical protein OJAV_G00008190 [Oryzias javanicus]